jgi:DNA polymerase III subunit epsilon
MQQADIREIIFDTETTGLDPKSGHRIVEIGCIEMINMIETGQTLHLYFNPERAMPPEAEAVHGLSERFLSDKPLFQSKIEEILKFIGDAQLVAHNARFDFGFINAEFAACGRPPLDPARMVDTLAMARTLHPGAKHSLDSLCVRYGIDRSRRVKHGALLDAELLAQLYVELRGGRQIGLGLAAQGIGAQSVPDMMHISSRKNTNNRPFRAPRTFSASPQELERHAEFLGTLTHPLWVTSAGE